MIDIGIATRHGQSKNDENVASKSSNIPISYWTKILFIEELKSNFIKDGQALIWLNLAIYA